MSVCPYGCADPATCPYPHAGCRHCAVKRTEAALLDIGPMDGRPPRRTDWRAVGSLALFAAVAFVLTAWAILGPVPR